MGQQAFQAGVEPCKGGSKERLRQALQKQGSGLAATRRHAEGVPGVPPKLCTTRCCRAVQWGLMEGVEHTAGDDSTPSGLRGTAWSRTLHLAESWSKQQGHHQSGRAKG